MNKDVDDAIVRVLQCMAAIVIVALIVAQLP